MQLPFLHAIPDAELPSQVEWFFATSRKVQLQQLMYEETPTSEDQAEGFRLSSLALAKSLHYIASSQSVGTPSRVHRPNGCSYVTKNMSGCIKGVRFVKYWPGNDLNYEELKGIRCTLPCCYAWLRYSRHSIKTSKSGGLGQPFRASNEVVLSSSPSMNLSPLTGRVLEDQCSLSYDASRIHPTLEQCTSWCRPHDTISFL